MGVRGLLGEWTTMIAIVNIDPDPRETGFHLYEIRINKTPITRFMHMRENGLEECLELAALAVRYKDKCPPEGRVQ